MSAAAIVALSLKLLAPDMNLGPAQPYVDAIASRYEYTVDNKCLNAPGFLLKDEKTEHGRTRIKVSAKKNAIYLSYRRDF